MGYFNYFIKCIIRNFVKFIFNKKNFFKFCCILFFGFVIFTILSNTEVYGATTVVDDTTYYDGIMADIELYSDLQRDFITRCYAKNYNTNSPEELELLLNRLSNGNYTSLFYYQDYVGDAYKSSSPSDKRRLYVVLIPMWGQTSIGIESINWNNNGYVTCNKLQSNTDEHYLLFEFYNNYINQYQVTANDFTHLIPTFLINYRCSELIDFFIAYKNEGYSSIVDSIQSSTNTIVESNKETQNTIKEQTDFLTSNTISDNSFVFPEDNTNDTTGVDDEINFVFNDIMNAFTDTTSNNFITLTFPFTDQTFNISYASVYNGVFERNSGMTYLKTIIQLGYWYIIAVYVIKDISNKVNKVKTGDIDKIQTGNIKEDLL